MGVGSYWRNNRGAKGKCFNNQLETQIMNFAQSLWISLTLLMWIPTSHKEALLLLVSLAV